MGATAARVGGFVAGEGLVVFSVGVGFAVGEGVVDVKASSILLIAINTADEIGDVLIGGVEFGIVVIDIEGVVVCCGCGICCWVVVCFCCCCVFAVCCGHCC